MEPIEEFLAYVEKRIYDREVQYYKSSMVEHLVQEAYHCSARVLGSDWEPYEVDILLSEENQVRDWNCTCPYDGGDVCKHVVAVLLAIQDGRAGERKAPQGQAERCRRLRRSYCWTRGPKGCLPP